MPTSLRQSLTIVRNAAMQGWAQNLGTLDAAKVGLDGCQMDDGRARVP